VKRTATIGVLSCLLLSGCSLIESILNLPVKAVDTVMPGSTPPPIDPAALQTEIERFADEFTSRSVVAIEEYARNAGTNDARRRALLAKLALSTSAFSIASAPNPFASMLDFVALATVTRRILEEEWVVSPEGQAYVPWLETARALEKDAWSLTEGILTPTQKEELISVIERWHAANRSVSILFFARPQELTGLFRQFVKGKDKASSLLGLVGLDPTAALDPAVREVARTRLFAERALYTLQRMPYVVRWHVEVLADRLFDREEINTVLASASLVAESMERVSRATETASEVAAMLPDRLSAEREAILESFRSEQGKLEQLSADVRLTLSQSEKTFVALDTTVRSFDAMLRRLGLEPKGEGAPEPPATAPTPEPGSKPFDVLDYAHTAEKVAGMARDVNGLLVQAESTLDSPALKKSVGEVEALSARAADEAKSLLNHAFLLGAGLIVLAFGCALAYGRLAPRLKGSVRQHRREPELRS
jgi:hypothetical protein